MTDAGFFRGTSTEQDVRFSDKDKKLLKMMKFEDCLEQKVDMHKVNFEALKPWVSEQVTKILGIEDEVVIELIFSFLENDRYPNAKKLQILVTGFLQSKPARIFIGQLWDLLLSAQGNPAKLPERFIEEKKNAIRQQKKKIEMELTMREDQRRFSPLRDSHYFSGRSADPPRSPGRKSDRRNRTELSETGVDVLKSEASSTQVDTEHTEGKNIAQTADTQTENKFKTEPDNEQLEGRKGLEREREGRGEYRDKPRVRSRSRSYSPKGRRHRSRSHDRERRYRYRSSPHRRQHSPVYSPDSHAHQQRGRGHHRESPRQSRPHRSLEERHYHERPIDPPKHKEHHDTSPHTIQRVSHADIQDTTTHPSEHYSSATKKHSSIEVQTDSRRGHGSSKRRKVTPPLTPHGTKGKGSAKHSHRTKQREESLSSSSHSPPPVEKRRVRGEEVRTREKEFSASSSVSSESESSPTPEKHRHTSHTSRLSNQSKPRVSREPVRSRGENSPGGDTRSSRKQSKHKHHPRDTHSLSESERSEHTSDNFSEVEARRKEAVKAKKLKNTLSVKKKQRGRERERYSSGRSKVSSKRGHSEHRSVIGSKRKHSSRRVRSHDDSYDSENRHEGRRDRAKKRHTHISPVVVKKSRHRLPPPESNTDSSDSEETSSSDSDSEWSGERRRGDKKKSRVESSEDSSESEDSTKRERGRSSLEKHLREKVIQAMSKKRLKKNKS